MPKAARGVLVQCDPSIKAIINKIDEKFHDFIIEDLDDQTVVIKEAKLHELKERLADVSVHVLEHPGPLYSRDQAFLVEKDIELRYDRKRRTDACIQELKDTQMEVDDSGSE